MHSVPTQDENANTSTFKELQLLNTIREKSISSQSSDELSPVDDVDPSAPTYVNLMSMYNPIAD